MKHYIEGLKCNTEGVFGAALDAAYEEGFAWTEKYYKHMVEDTGRMSHGRFREGGIKYVRDEEVEGTGKRLLVEFASHLDYPEYPVKETSDFMGALGSTGLYQYDPNYVHDMYTALDTGLWEGFVKFIDELEADDDLD